MVEHFVHIAEEPPINPSLMIVIGGCGLKCAFCQQPDIRDSKRLYGRTLDHECWNILNKRGARSLTFIGGNPDESLFSILNFLGSAPEDWNLPVVWNCHGYASAETISLLHGVVDAYVPDFKYGNDDCGQNLSNVSAYPPTAFSAVSAMLSQNIPVFVRMLILPGHVDCCHKPAIEMLSKLKSDWLWLSIRNQYFPERSAVPVDKRLFRRVTVEEAADVTQHALRYGLKLIEQEII